MNVAEGGRQHGEVLTVWLLSVEISVWHLSTWRAAALRYEGQAQRLLHGGEQLVLVSRLACLNLYVLAGQLC